VVILKVSAPAGNDEVAMKRLRSSFAAQARLLFDMMQSLESTRFAHQGKQFPTQAVVI
jgi:hypothetical protein